MPSPVFNNIFLFLPKLALKRWKQVKCCQVVGFSLFSFILLTLRTFGILVTSHTHTLSLLLLCSVLTFRRMGKAKLQLSSWIPASLPLFHSHSSWYSTIQRERGQFYAKHARVTRSGVIFSQQMPPCWKNYHKDLNVAFPFKNILNILLIMGYTVLCSHNMWWMDGIYGQNSLVHDLKYSYHQNGCMITELDMSHYTTISIELGLNNMERQTIADVEASMFVWFSGTSILLNIKLAITEVSEKVSPT